MKTASPPTTVTLVRKQLDSPVDLLALWANSQVTQKAYWAIPVSYTHLTLPTKA